MTKYNKGQLYEKEIRKLLRQQNLLPENLHGNDAGFIHKGVEYFLEVKNKDAPDFGQKGLIWSQENGWEWRENDTISELLDIFGVIELIDPEFIPRRHSIQKHRITLEEKRYDQQQIKISGVELEDIHYLYEYYARKNCYYIQVEGKGFYFLLEDIAKLNVPQFSPKLTLRLRAKTHHRDPIYAYSFFAVINSNTSRIPKSIYDIEEKIGEFPPI
jgi:hypothetical protein